MGYDHSLSTSATLKQGVMLDQLVVALEPLFKYFGYDGHKVFNGTEELYSDHEFHWLPETREFSIYTNGDVRDDFEDLVEKVAKILGPLVEQPGEFELKNFDTADLDNAITEIAYGESEAVIKQYKSEVDIIQAMFILEKHLTVPVMNQIRLLAKGVLEPKKVEQASMLQTVESVLHIALLNGDFSSLGALLEDVKKVNSLQPKAA